ncbi:MAG: Gfo/Idh/MocA family oxidoreductase [Clostridia bacterium]|nr:Gfo/Idh/MocA family oxidoreductase [Clostridia bacterium]
MEKTKVAMIGCGGRNKVHLDKLSAIEEVEFVGFCDVLPERAEAFRNIVGQGKTFTSHTELLAAVDPDVVYIAVPPHQHGAIEFAVIEKGCHFMVEKPMALNYETAEKIEKAAEAKNLITGVGFQDRYQNLTITMKEYLKDRKVGLVQAAWMGGIPGVAWWRRQATCGGQIVEQNIHLYDQLRYLFGEVKTVYCRADKGIVEPDSAEYNVPGYDLEDYSSAVLTFENGVIANVFTSCYHRPGSVTDSGMTVYAKNATLRYKLRSTLDITDENGVHETLSRGEEQTGIMDRTFINAVRTGDTSGILSDYKDALKSLKLVLACNESIETGKTVEL